MLNPNLTWGRVGAQQNRLARGYSPESVNSDDGGVEEGVFWGCISGRWARARALG